MKRRLTAIILTLCLLITIAPAQRAEAASNVCFIARNDTLLDLGSPALFQGATLYVPYSAFVYFRVYYSYYSEKSTATLYTASNQLYFEMESGNTYDSSGNYYSGSAIFMNGQVYVSVDLVCTVFGLSWSYIYGTDSGDICRIKNGGEVLSDSQFLSAASSLMTARYNAYIGNSTGTGTQDPASPEGNEEEGCELYLSFQGMPSSVMLDALKFYGVTACFFVTAHEVSENPDTVRRITGEGHNIGVLCSDDPAAEYDAASELIFEAARVKTVLIASTAPEFDDLCRSAAEENGLVFWSYDIDGVRGGEGISYASYVTAYLPFAVARADMRILCCAASDGCISTVLSYISRNNFVLRKVCEVGSTI